MGVADILYASIFAGTYPPNYKLPSLWEMSRMYGVSVATVPRGITEVESRDSLRLLKTVDKTMKTINMIDR